MTKANNETEAQKATIAIQVAKLRFEPRQPSPAPKATPLITILC